MAIYTYNLLPVMTMILVVVMLIIGFWFKVELCAKKAQTCMPERNQGCQYRVRITRKPMVVTTATCAYLSIYTYTLHTACVYKFMIR